MLQRQVTSMVQNVQLNAKILSINGRQYRSLTSSDYVKRVLGEAYVPPRSNSGENTDSEAFKDSRGSPIEQEVQSRLEPYDEGANAPPNHENRLVGSRRGGTRPPGFEGMPISKERDMVKDGINMSGNQSGLSKPPGFGGPHQYAKDKEIKSSENFQKKSNYKAGLQVDPEVIFLHIFATLRFFVRIDLSYILATNFASLDWRIPFSSSSKNFLLGMGIKVLINWALKVKIALVPAERQANCPFPDKKCIAKGKLMKFNQESLKKRD